MPDENAGVDELIDERYRGIRPAPGYPACPDHTEKRRCSRCSTRLRTAGIELTENFAMWPGAAVSAASTSHPDSQYFAVGRIERDQVEDYARRKGWPIPTKPWLYSSTSQTRYLLLWRARTGVFTLTY
jgi:5-methyltetrahydrofolate--homocysteine methyltransferase